MANQLEDSMKEGDNPLRITIRPPGVKNYDGATDNNWLHNFMRSNEPSPLIDNIKKLADYLQNTQFSPGTRTGNRIFGTGSEERYQFWPERMVRSALTLPGDVMSGSTPVQSIDPVTGEAHTSPQAIERAQDTAGLMGSSTLFRAPTPATLGSGAMRFYSPVEQAIENATQKSGPLQQWLGFLKNSKGVKPEELSWLGLEGAPELQGNITKQQLQDYVNAHKVDLQEVTKGNGPRTLNDLTDQQRRDLLENYRETNGVPSNEIPHPRELERYLQAMDEEYGRPDAGSATRYSTYQLPGGENYREHLLTLPYKDINTRVREFAKENNINDIDTAYSEFEKKFGSGNSTFYQSSHWDEPNVLAHIRSNERDVEGVPSLHLEEIQSDWHQQGRKHGYNSRQTVQLKNELETIRNKLLYDLPPEETAALRARRDEIKEQLNLFDSGNSYRQVPDAPFKTSWPELALKRMIQLAAQEGKSRISWTPGEAQAARYDLSKQIDKLKWTKNDDGTYNLAPYKNNQLVNYRPGANPQLAAAAGASYLNVHPTKLADYVGKDVADRIIRGEGQVKKKKTIDIGDSVRLAPSAHPVFADIQGLEGKLVARQSGRYPFVVEFSNGAKKEFTKSELEAVGNSTTGELAGLDLKIGGEGMKGFYDKMLPKMVEKLGKQYGVKVKKGRLPGDSVYNPKTSKMDNVLGPEVYYFDIPPELAQQATGKGMPLFVGGVPVVPVEGNPFEEKKK